MPATIDTGLLVSGWIHDFTRTYVGVWSALWDIGVCEFVRCTRAAMRNFTRRSSRNKSILFLLFVAELGKSFRWVAFCLSSSIS